MPEYVGDALYLEPAAMRLQHTKITYKNIYGAEVETWSPDRTNIENETIQVTLTSNSVVLGTDQ